MGESKHTPGPWAPIELKLGSRTFWIAISAGGKLPEIEGNARLIAAAPDLLSIVKRFIALPSSAWHPDRYAAEEAELKKEAKAAIWAAEGRSDA